MSTPPKPRSRKKIIWLALVVIVAAGFAYARWVEPYWIEATHLRVDAPVSPAVKFAHLSDLHTREFGRRERAVLALLDLEKPDVIVVTGDSLSGDADYDEVREILSRLRAPLGVFVVRGNWEAWRPAPGERKFYEQAGVRLLLNQNAEVRPGLWLAGFDDAAFGDPNLVKGLNGVAEGAYVVALFHSPIFFERIAGGAPLALAGHTHGGQIRLPYYGPFWLPPGAGRYVEGWYERDGSRMFVSRGVGTSVLHFRFACRPQVAFVTLGR
jgi:hypothetical protein